MKDVNFVVIQFLLQIISKMSLYYGDIAKMVWPFSDAKSMNGSR